jgi:hypothetical protein
MRQASLQDDLKQVPINKRIQKKRKKSMGCMKEILLIE